MFSFIKKIFIKKQIIKKQISNQKKPFVLIDIDNDDSSRGDTHGYIGIAEKIAEKIDANFLFIDEKKLLNMYPSIKDKEERLKELFNEKGYPDFFFSRPLFNKWNYRKVMANLSKKGCGLIISSINEDLKDILKVPKAIKELVASHITKRNLADEGKKFKEYYKNFPKPLVGINLINLDITEADAFTKKVKETLKSFGQGSLFVCGTRRTPNSQYDRLISELKETFKEGNFKVEGFNYKKSLQKDPRFKKTFNPYIGLLDQADHLFLLGDSQSIASEIITSGKTCHIARYPQYNCPALTKAQYIKDIFNYSSKAPLKTDKIELPNVTEAFAEALISKHDTWVRKPKTNIIEQKTYKFI